LLREARLNLQLDGRVALVTGSARGIGAETARYLCQEGAAVIVCDIDGEGAEKFAAELEREGYKALGVRCDVTSESDVWEMVKTACDLIGQPDILVNNAGFNRDKYLTRMAESDWDSVVDTILKGAFHCSRAVLPLMMEKKWGRIINISSRSVFGNPGQTNYSAAKMGLIGFTRALALEQGKYGITVNAVAPGFIETDGMKANPTHAKLRELALQKTPVGFLGEPCDVAAAVTFLASPQARYISGTTLFVTGGRFSS